MTNISLQNNNVRTLDQFFNAAERAEQASKLDKTIKLGGSTGVKYVGWTTWKSTNCKTMSAFVNAIRQQYGKDARTLLSNRAIFGDFRRPLTARNIRFVQDELKKIDKRNELEDFFKGKDGQISQADRMADEIISAARGQASTMPQAFFDNLKKQGLKMAKYFLNKKLENGENIIDTDFREEIVTCFDEIKYGWENTYNKLEFDKHQLKETLCKHLTSAVFIVPSQTKLYGGILLDMAKMGKLGAMDNQQDSRNEALMIYEEVCTRAGKTPENLGNQMPLPSIYDKISKAVVALQKSNETCATTLKSICDAQLSLEKKSAFQDLLQKMGNEHPFMKEFTAELYNELEKGRTDNPVFQRSISYVSEQIPLEQHLVTNEKLLAMMGKSICQKYLMQKMQDFVTSEFTERGKSGQFNEDDLKAATRTLVCRVTNNDYPVVEKFLAKVLDNTVTDDEFKKAVADMKEELKAQIDSAIAFHKYNRETESAICSEIQKQCQLSDDEMKFLSTESFKQRSSSVADEHVSEHLSYQGFEELFKKEKQKFLDVKIIQINELKSHKDEMDKEIYDRFLNRLLSKNDMYRIPTRIRREFEIAAVFDIDTLSSLEKMKNGSEKDEASIESIASVFKEIGEKLNRVITDEDMGDGTAGITDFLCDILAIVIGRNPELKEKLKGLAEDKNYIDAIQTIQNERMAVGDEIRDLEFQESAAPSEEKQAVEEKLHKIKMALFFCTSLDYVLKKEL